MVAYMASLTWEGMFTSPQVSPQKDQSLRRPCINCIGEFNSDHRLVWSPPSENAQMAQSATRLVSYPYLPSTL